MSMAGGAIAQAFGALGGPGVAAAIVGGGLLVGALGGGIAASQSGPAGAATAGGRLAVYGCPDGGAPLAMVEAGQRLLATGRTADGTWLRIHFPEPGRTEAWVQASPLQVAGAVDSLPVAECQPELAIAPPSLAPAASLTAVGDHPPTQPPVAEATPTPTPATTASAGPTAVANTRPAIGSLTASTKRISYDTDDYCPDAGTRVTFRVRASDEQGVDGVRLFWRAPGAGSFSAVPMTRTAGSARSGTWQAGLDTTANRITRAGRLAYYALATDGSGATRRVPRSGSDSIAVAVCENTGPTIRNAASSAGNVLHWNPLGSPDSSCQTATNITAVVRDPDGVESVTLFYRRPGSGAWQRKPMDRTIKGRWYANLDTLGDKITIPDPPRGTLRWYIRAVDDKGKATKSPTTTISVRRCDTKADVSRPSIQFSGSCGPINVFGDALDPDGIGRSSAVLEYTYRRQNGSSATVRIRMTGTQDGDRWYYRVTIQPDSSWSDDRFTMNAHLEVTDRFGYKYRGEAVAPTVPGCK